MPREFSDVLHYFLPEAEPKPEPEPATPSRTAAHGQPPSDRRSSQRAPSTGETEHTRDPKGSGWTRLEVGRPSALSLVAVPIECGDVVRAGLLWNLAIETARHGSPCLLLRTDVDGAAPAWPRDGRQPLGAEVITCAAQNLSELYREAVDQKLRRGANGEPGLMLVEVPPRWLLAPGDGAALLDFTLLLTRGERTDLRETWALARTLVRARPRARLGVTIHGASSLEGAEASFGALARVVQNRLGRDVESFGLLVDDLHVVRAVTAHRPIGLVHPQSLAARALGDVAGLLIGDLNERQPGPVGRDGVGDGFSDGHTSTSAAGTRYEDGP